jgi:hypothetical protein
MISHQYDSKYHFQLVKQSIKKRFCYKRVLYNNKTLKVFRYNIKYNIKIYNIKQ